ncbi:nitrogen fixation protein NifR [Staphylococcus aureus]|nr:nitrogen fixation protein NifR [Staphylococcus aureus]
MQVGVGRRNKFCENIISVPLPPIFKYTLALTNDKESLHNQSLVVLYHFRPALNKCYSISLL